MPPILQIQHLSKSFGGITAVMEVSFDVQPGEILAIIGPNGAGKTTLFNLISGVYPPTRGEVRMEGHALAGLAPHRRADLGLARTFQNLRLFENMTVLENVMVGCHRRERYGLVPAAVRLPQAQRGEARMRDEARACLDLIGLGARADEPIGALPFGQQRLVQIARALAGKPRILLLDEPAAGLTRGETNALDDLIRRLAAEGLTVLLVEHDMPLVMGIANRVLVLNFGEKIAEGAPAAIQQDERVIAAYLGGEKQSRLTALLAKEQEERAAAARAAVAAEGSGGSAPLLQARDLSTYYGPIRALDRVNLKIMPSEIVALIGANGAGKTTFLNTLAGLLTPRAGAVSFDQRDITGWSAEAVVKAGVSLVPERRQIFSTQSVRDNLLLGAYAHRRTRTELEQDLNYVFELFPILKQRVHQPGGTLSGGEQQMLAVARGLMSRPRLLLLDEPSVGLAPLLVRAILGIVSDLRARGTTILLVEQNAQAALEVADRAYVFETGRVALEGAARDLVRDPSVQRAYLGGARGH